MAAPKPAMALVFDRAGKGCQVFDNFEKNTEMVLQVDDQITVTTKPDPDIALHLPPELQDVPLLQVVYTGQLGGPGVYGMFAFSRALRLASEAPVIPACTFLVEGESPTIQSGEQRGWSWGVTRERISTADCEAALRIYPEVRRIFESEMQVYNRLSNAHRFFDNAYDQGNADMAIVGFVTVLEGLLLTTDKEISRRLSLRLAQFLGRDLMEKKDRFRKAKEIYKCRSNIVHGGAVIKNGDAERAAICVVDYIAPMTARFARAVLLKIYEEGLTDVFESRARVNKLFNEPAFRLDSESIPLP